MKILATIKTAIALYDGVTSPLQSMKRAMDIVINSFETMQRTSSKAVDVSAIQEARAELAKAETAFDSIEQKISEADQRQQGFNSHVSKGSTAAGGLLSKLKEIALAAGALAATQKVLNISDQLTSTNARLNNAIINFDDGDSLTDLEQKVMASAQRSRSYYMDTASAVAKLGLNAKDAFGSMDEVIGFSELINKQFVIGGASAQEQSAAMLQLTQAMASGVLRGDELRSIFEQAPGIIQNIADYMNVPIGKIRDMAAEGEITADIVKNATFEASDEIEKRFSNMPKTWAQIWIEMKNKALSIFAPILDKVNEIGNSEQFQSVMDGLINGLAFLAQIATVVFDIIVGIASAVIDNWSWISPIIYGVAAALAVYYGAILLTKAVETVLAVAHGIVTVAQLGLNAAIAACPIVWIIIAIVALIAIFYAAVAAINHFAGTSYSATGMICGAFMAALAFIGNIFVAAGNLIIDVFVLIYNLVATVANFIGNVFTDPVGAVCRLFFDLADTVLSVLQSLASAIDTIFGYNLSESVQGWRDSLGGWVDETFGKGTEVMAKLNADDLYLERFEYGAAFQLGDEFGRGIEEKVSGLFDFPEASDSPYSDTAQFPEASDSPYSDTAQFPEDTGLGSIVDNTGDTAVNTAQMADSLDASEEELKLIREIAERQAINKFTTAEVKLDFTGMTNKIDSDMDLDGFVSEFTVRLEDALYAVAEGVHT